MARLSSLINKHDDVQHAWEETTRRGVEWDEGRKKKPTVAGTLLNCNTCANSTSKRDKKN